MTAAPRIAELKREWNWICLEMADGTYRGTEAEALAEIERIKAEIAELEKSMTDLIDLIDRKSLVVFMERVFVTLEADTTVSDSYLRGYRYALNDVLRAPAVKVEVAE
ncbi:MAG: hypothetical protein ACLGIP_16740 [Alphaproteobacteria bacterium]